MHNFTSKPKILKFALFAVFAVLAFNVSAQVKSTFTPRFSDGVNGDIAIIANNMVSEHATNAYTGEGDNNGITSVYVDIDSDGSTFNSSSANLVNPSPSSACLTFRRAFLYWAAANKEHGDDDGDVESEWERQLPQRAISHCAGAFGNQFAQ